MSHRWTELNPDLDHVPDEISFLRGTTERWIELNPILPEGMPGLEIIDGRPARLKFGDGVTRWNDLPYFTGASGEFSNPELIAHIDSPNPHPVYDEGTSLVARYRNAKV